ncbi:MAG: hypothetical protein COU31_01925 [Candidatus Magasanikbacteria bacterium CG10_big_fil_rev_8_21_14_0_10_40_10]|uniref:RelA/SpoT domain-containing protein n=1 Tax=Candidatus Magasanikbacteria bacterium CG10_big_fil_rev_8_21_14_0_10_40_10 TaxID=1974648 RepID=A0A2M6W474_9BACT|nr:MAG: hypothetical protein COU31_01925 [Candidatus Magasanikbacteria bacterium CG10_big_fil_rev_8_21_14_0_10_40_10]
MDKNLKKILTEYRAKKNLYAEYCNVVHVLLENILHSGNYKYHMNSRVKEINSLKEKVKAKKQRGKIYKQLSDVKDIAGIRVVFYTDSERKRFIYSLRNEFEKKIIVQETEKKTGYRSTHIIVNFGNKRIRLSEYKKFKGLECEIQLALILNHAWAEVEHDILYKDDLHLNNLDEKKYSLLKQRMQKVMDNYIKNASNELEEIVGYVKRLKKHK